MADEGFDERLIDRTALGLVVRTIVAGVCRRAVFTRCAVGRASRCAAAGAFIEADAEELQRVDDRIDGAFHIALVVRVFDPQVEGSRRAVGSLALVGQTFIYERPVKVAQVDEAGGGGPQSRDDRAAFCICARRVYGLVVFRCFIDLRKQQLRQFVVVH